MASSDNGITVLVSKEIVVVNGGAPDAPPQSSSSRRKPDAYVRSGFLRGFLANLRLVLLGTKLSALFVAIPFAIVAQYHRCGSPWVFALSLLGLAPLAERLSFLTEKIAFYTGPTVYSWPSLNFLFLKPEDRLNLRNFKFMVFALLSYNVGGLLNATCGNVTELIIAILALIQHKVEVVKYSLLGSILSNLLFVLGTSLFCGGIANLSKEQKFDRNQADVNALLLLLGLLCHVLPLTYKFSGKSPELIATGTLHLSRASCILMLIAYIAYLIFQLWTHRRFFESQEVKPDPAEEEDEDEDESPAIGFWSAFIWLVIMTGVVALLSEYIVATIEAASDSWGLSVSFISVILLPISGNAAEHAAAIIFAFKNKLDITLGVALGSATQIAMFVMPLSVIVSWVVGIEMGLDFTLLETSALGLSIILTAFALQDGTSHYMKGLVLILAYIVIASCFFLFTAPLGTGDFVFDS